MPYTKKSNRGIAKAEGLEKFRDWLKTIPIEQRKGELAFAVKYLGLTTFENNYFGLSTATDAVRSAFLELEVDLFEYEKIKRRINGDTL